MSNELINELKDNMDKVIEELIRLGIHKTYIEIELLFHIKNILKKEEK